MASAPGNGGEGFAAALLTPAAATIGRFCFWSLGFGLDRGPRTYARKGRPSQSQVNSTLEPNVVRSHRILMNAATALRVTGNEPLFFLQAVLEYPHAQRRRAPIIS
jgi:hypothetical protein